MSGIPHFTVCSYRLEQQDHLTGMWETISLELVKPRFEPRIERMCFGLITFKREVLVDYRQTLAQARTEIMRHYEMNKHMIPRCNKVRVVEVKWDRDEDNPDYLERVVWKDGEWIDEA